MNSEERASPASEGVGWIETNSKPCKQIKEGTFNWRDSPPPPYQPYKPHPSSKTHGLKLK